jgi:hypothetical protein
MAHAKTLSPSNSGWHRSMTTRQHLVFLVLPPLLLGWTSGVSEFGSVSFSAKWVHVCFAFFTYFPNWFSNELFSWLGATVARRWQLPLWPALVFGVLVTAALHAPFTIVRDALFEPYLAPGAHFFQTWPPNYADIKYSTEAALAFASRLAFWLTVNAAAIYLMGFSRFGFTSLFQGKASLRHTEELAPLPPKTVQTSDSQAIKRLFDRVPPELGRELTHLTAQEHYTRVSTTKGSGLIYMRFADAVALAQTAIPGQRVHRSYWVADQAIDRLETNGAKLSIVLSTGQTIPVSRSYREQVRARDDITLPQAR